MTNNNILAELSDEIIIEKLVHAFILIGEKKIAQIIKNTSIFLVSHTIILHQIVWFIFL